MATRPAASQAHRDAARAPELPAYLRSDTPVDPHGEPIFAAYLTTLESNEAIDEPAGNGSTHPQ